MLKALARWILRNDAPKKRQRHEPEYLTREEAKELFDELSKQLVYEWNEWYEKFDKLHLRLAKRADRERRKAEENSNHAFSEEQQEALPSALNFRGNWSV